MGAVLYMIDLRLAAIVTWTAISVFVGFVTYGILKLFQKRQ
jgi:hypothetical protein